jgi:hypothetical protein
MSAHHGLTSHTTRSDNKQALGALDDYVEVLPRPAAHATGPLPGVLAGAAAAEPEAGGPEALDSPAAPRTGPAAATAHVSLQQTAADKASIPVAAAKLPGGLASGRHRAQPVQAARVHSCLSLAVSELVSAAEAAADAATARAAIDILLQVHTAWPCCVLLQCYSIVCKSVLNER